MSYHRHRRRRPRRVTKARAKSRKGARAQSSQILTLQRQVDRIRRQTKDNTKYVQFQYQQTAAIGGATGPTFSVWNLIAPVNWTPIFQTHNSGFLGVTPDKFRGRNIRMEFMAQVGNVIAGNPSPDPITATVFLCSLRKEVSKQFVHDTNNGVDIEEGVHYNLTNMGAVQGSGMVMLNPGIFKIRRVKRFMLGGATNFYSNDDDEPLAATTNLKDNNRRWTWKVPYRNLIKDSGPDTRASTGASGYKAMTIDDVEPLDQLYVFGFSNAYADQAVDLNMNCIITGTTTNASG